MARGAVGIKDVAERAGVAIGTVSNVLNRPEIVSAARRERVEAAIAELGYVRNEAARGLKVGTSRMVGSIVLDAANPFYAAVVAGMESAAEDSGLVVMSGSSGNQAPRERQHLRLFAEQRMRGILLASTGGCDDLVAAIRDRGTPIVEVEHHTAGAASSSVAVVLARTEFAQVDKRLAGARAAAEEGGAECEVIGARTLTVLAGRSVGEQIAARTRAERPDALFCVNDLLAVGVLQAFAYGGRIAVPEDVALVGYDDIEFARSTVVPLTSIAQPAELMGRTALALLEEQVAGRGSGPFRHVDFSPELVVRESSAP